MDVDEIDARIEQGEDPTKLSRADAGPELTLRERYRRTMQYRRVDRIPNFEFGYWSGLLQKWHQQGLPASINTEAEAYAFFGIESWRGAPLRLRLHPGFETEILEETEEHITYRNGDRTVCRETKPQGQGSIPHFLEFGLKDRRDRQDPRARDAPSTLPLTRPNSPASPRRTLTRCSLTPRSIRPIWKYQAGAMGVPWW